MVTTSLSEVTCPEQLRLSCCEVWQPRQLGTAPCKVHIGNLLTHAGRLLHIKVLDFDLSHYVPSLKELRTTQTSETPADMHQVHWLHMRSGMSSLAISTTCCMSSITL